MSAMSAFTELSAGLCGALAGGAQRLRGTLAAPCLSILFFHRVAQRVDELLPSEPDAARFDALMRLVARAFRVMTLGEAIDHLAQGSLPQRALTITFDDGYADNARVALPILQRHRLRATFFVASGFIDGGRMWNDSVIECVRRCDAAEIDLAEFGPGLGSVALSGAAERRQAIAALLPRLKYLPPAQRDAAIDRLQRICGVAALPSGLMMRSAEVRALHAAGMEVGAHTQNHPILTSLAPAAAEDEIVRGRAELEAMTGARVDVFAYPNGQPGVDYDRTHVELVRRLGFRGAVTTAPGVARVGDDPYQLPRFTPWDRALPLWTARLLRNQHNRRCAVAGAAAATPAL